MADQFVYTGSMTHSSVHFPDAAGEGLVVWRWPDGSDRLERIDVVQHLVNPSWLALDARRLRLYATGERHDSNDGWIVVFDIDGKSGRLTLIENYPSLGSATCHLAASPDGAMLAWANYGTMRLGSSPDASFVLRDFGAPRQVLRPFAHPGRAPSATGRQARRHAHCVLFDPVRARLIITDLGLDALFTIGTGDDPEALPERIFSFPPGSGPRHITARADFCVFYVVHEISARIDVLVADGKGLDLVQTLEIGARGVSQPAGLVLAPDGRHLLASERGSDEIRGFAVRPDGHLMLPQANLKTARAPRDISFTPDGLHLLVAGQDDGEIRACRYDAETGRLSHQKVIARTGSPTCVRSFEPNKD